MPWPVRDGSQFKRTFSGWARPSRFRAWILPSRGLEGKGFRPSGREGKHGSDARDGLAGPTSPRAFPDCRTPGPIPGALRPLTVEDEPAVDPQVLKSLVIRLWFAPRWQARSPSRVAARAARVGTQRRRDERALNAGARAGPQDQRGRHAGGPDARPPCSTPARAPDVASQDPRPESALTSGYLRRPLGHSSATAPWFIRSAEPTLPLAQGLAIVRPLGHRHRRNLHPRSRRAPPRRHRTCHRPMSSLPRTRARDAARAPREGPGPRLVPCGRGRRVCCRWRRCRRPGSRRGRLDIGRWQARWRRGGARRDCGYRLRRWR